MAEYTARDIKHATTVANTVDTVTLTGTGNAIEIINLGPYALYISRNETNPTVEGDNFEVVPSGASLRFTDNDGTLPAIKVISSGVTKYAVAGR